jgi:ankyrin repeat protein
MVQPKKRGIVTGTIQNMGFTIDLLFKRGCQVNQLDHMRQTPLFFAAANGHKELISPFVKSYKVDIN